ncbi:hypothetical protein [Streptomyces sp. AM6-12]
MSAREPRTSRNVSRPGLLPMTGPRDGAFADFFRAGDLEPAERAALD